MIVNEIKLMNFRNYQQLKLNVNPKLNVFLGENAQGKTNIIEAIYLCAIGKSFRPNKDAELINTNKNQAYTKVKVNKSTGEVNIEVKLDKEQKKSIKINHLSINKISELLGNLNVVLFSPEDLRMIKDGPSERRRFIDIDISQIYPKYYHTLTQYNRILKHRNKLLKENRGRTIDLEVWDEQLIEAGASIVFYRQRFVKRLSILAKLIHRRLTDEHENLEIQYMPSFTIKDSDDTDALKEKLRNKLKSNIQNELRRGITLVGPHRDDINLRINQLDVKSFGSQGQQRTAVLSLKLSELELIKSEIGEYPVLLLDDVMSELDIKRQSYILNNLKNIQTFITTTMIDHLQLSEIKEKQIFYVSNGEISLSD